MTHAEITALRKWYFERPPAVRAAIQQFPPGTKVKAVEGKRLICPAPGVEAVIISYCEYGSDPVGFRVSDGVWGAECQADWIEFSSFQEGMEDVREAIRSFAE